MTHTGSPDAASLLRRNLTAIADQHHGTAMARRVREVLAGQRDLADLEGDPDFMRLMRSGVQQYEDHVASLSTEEKARLYAEAQELRDREAPDG
ncbi:MAG: hypothetical protein LH477_15060 [Nocardioides sp.]|nr:hypothetical protein [Nocardioides sp.]